MKTVIFLVATLISQIVLANPAEKNPTISGERLMIAAQLLTSANIPYAELTLGKYTVEDTLGKLLNKGYHMVAGGDIDEVTPIVFTVGNGNEKVTNNCTLFTNAETKTATLCNCEISRSNSLYIRSSF